MLTKFKTRLVLGLCQVLMPNGARQLSIDTTRRQSKYFLGFRFRKEPVGRVEDRIVNTVDGEIPVRVYWPRKPVKPQPTPSPLLMYFHGGAWITAGINTHDQTCRKLCSGSASIVVSVGYRLAPEAAYPAAVDDCVGALRWAWENAGDLGADPALTVVAGDSAGGNLAAAVALKLRDQGAQVLGQLLIYPVMDLRFVESGSMKQFAKGFFLEREDLLWFSGLYVREQRDRTEPYASPLLVSNLSGLPPALIITGEFDPLRDEGEAYGLKLRAIGTPVEIVRYRGMLHGFFLWTYLFPEARNAVSYTNAWLRDLYQQRSRLPQRVKAQEYEAIEA